MMLPYFEFVPILILFTVFHGADLLSPPENPGYAREQKYLAPFKVDPEEALTCGQLIEYHGFKYEEHHVITADGYILTLYRIVNLEARKVLGNRLIPVLLVHGILLSCSSWLYNTHVHASQSNTDQSPIGANPFNMTSNDLAIVLAYAGYDVWIGNNRGTLYSRKHIRLTPLNRKFWDFSWVELGRYDVPAMVDYVRSETKFDKIVYIGYSRGTQQMLTLLAEDPSFADKLSLNILLAPIAFLGHLPGIQGSIPNSRMVYRLLSVYEGPIFPFQPEFNAGLTIFCTCPLFRPLCEEIYNYIVGPDRRNLDIQRFPVFTSLLDTTSAKCLIHELQATHFGQMRYYDHGNAKNLALYGSRYPPKINFTNVPTYNLVFFSGLIDYLATQENVQRLRNILRGRPLVDHIIEYAEWDHTDYLFGDNAYEYSHLPVLNIIRKYVGYSG